MDYSAIPASFQGLLGMGAPRSFHPARKIHRVGNLVAFFLLLAASAALFLYGIYDTYQAYQQHGPAVIDNKLTGPAIFALVLFGLGLLAGWSAYANWNKAAAAYENGFAFRDRKGLRAWSWEDLHTLTAAVTRHYTNGIYTGTTHVYTLINRRGEKVVLNDQLAKVEELAGAIEQGSFARLYERAAQVYNSGQVLAAGPVAVSKAGLQIGKKNYPWAEVDRVTIQQGMLKVSRRDGGWFSGASAAASAIPNLRVLLSIIDQVVGVKTK